MATPLETKAIPTTGTITTTAGGTSPILSLDLPQPSASLAQGQILITSDELVNYAWVPSPIEAHNENAVRAQQALLTPRLASTFAAAFRVGNNGTKSSGGSPLVVYGQLLTMTVRSPLIASADLSANGSGWWVAPDIAITAANAPAFVYAWCYINGIVDAMISLDQDTIAMPLKHNIQILDWLNYFQVSPNDEFYRLVQHDVGAAIDPSSEATAKAYNVPKPFDQDTLELLTGLLSSYSKRCLESPERHACDLMARVVKALAVSLSEDLADTARIAAMTPKQIRRLRDETKTTIATIEKLAAAGTEIPAGTIERLNQLITLVNKIAPVAPSSSVQRGKEPMGQLGLTSDSSVGLLGYAPRESAGETVATVSPGQTVAPGTGKILQRPELINYLKIPSHLHNEPTITGAIGLFTPSVGSSFGLPFVVGSQRLLIYGQLAPMMARSAVIAGASAELLHNAQAPAVRQVSWEELIGHRLQALIESKEPAVVFAKSMPITSDNAAGFIFVWLSMNGMANVLNAEGVMLEDYSLLELLHALDWASYFALDHMSEDVISLHYALDGKLFSLVEHARDTEPVLTTTEKDMLTRIYNSYVRRCLVDPKSAGELCQFANTIADALELPANDELKLAEMYAEPGGIISQWTNYLTGKLNAGPLSPAELRWAQRYYQHKLEQFRAGTVYPMATANALQQLASILTQAGQAVVVPSDVQDVAAGHAPGVTREREPSSIGLVSYIGAKAIGGQIGLI